MTNQFLSRLAFVLLLASPFVTLAPVYVEAATTNSTSATAVPVGCTATTAYSPMTGQKCPVPAGSLIPGCTATSAYSYLTGQKCVVTTTDATIDASSLTTASGSKSTLTGTADVSKIMLTVTASSSSSALYKSSSVTVHSRTWHVFVSKRLPNGAYTVSVYQSNSGRQGDLLATGTLYVGVQPTTLDVLPIALLGGGTAPAGSTQPISYLQVINNGNASTTINGFWVKEDGNAPVSAVIGFSTIDDKGLNRNSVGGVEGKTPFANGQAYVPSGAVIGPHQMKLFTIKAQLSANAGQYAGSALMLDVSGVDAQATFQNTFPVRGTTWVLSR